MKNTIRLCLLGCLSLNALAEENIVADDEHRQRIHSVRSVVANITKVKDKEVDAVGGIKHMFEDGVVSGEIRSIYSRYNYDDSQNIYATAIGGQLKYELAEYNGFNAGATFITTHEISPISGNNTKFNEELTSEKGDYTQLAEAYINYNYKNLNLRIGRQIVDTPLADSDDIRMTLNTFEAYMLTYKVDNIVLMSGLLTQFQGYDAGLDVDNPWQDTGEDGTYLAGITYETEPLEASAWYYDVSKDTDPNSLMQNNASKSIYLSLGGHIHFTKDNFLHLMAQYLNQSENDNSGVESRVYGGMAELVLGNIGFNIAYDKSNKQKNKRIFSGFGGGTMYTSMDNMIIENIAQDRDAYATVGGISYAVNKNFNFLYAYGDFHGNANSAGVSEHIIEHNIGFEYTKKSITIASIYTKQEDKDNTGVNNGDWSNIRILGSYSF